MSLATRCTACGTVFRVVQDQLKVSEGWVRCGRCKEVFNALEGLFDLEREAPPDWPSSVANLSGPGALVTEVDLPLPDIGQERDAHPPAPVVTLREDASPRPPMLAGASEDSEEDSASAPEANAGGPEFADARFETSSFASAVSLPAQADEAAPAPAEVEAGPPEFVRQAEQRARWETPRARALLFVLAGILAVTLGTQAALHFRDRLATQWPMTRPWLSQACDRVGCTLSALRRIEDLVVESSALTRAGTAGEALRLTIALRNRGSLTLAMPTFELSLTDANGELVVRRALSVREFSSRAATLPPHGEANLHLLFGTDGRRIAGYTIEIFYP